MKNKLFPILFALPVTTGICGAILRASQLKHAFDPASGILHQGHPVTYGLVAVCVIAVLMAIMASFLTKRGIEASAGSEKYSGYIDISMYIAAIVILAYAGLLLLSLSEEFNAPRLILALFSIYCAVSLIVMGKYHMEERNSTAYCVFSAVPAFWVCYLLILSFREKLSEPIIANYVPLILSYISILFFTYAIAAHVLGKDKKNIAVFACFSGIFFILVELLAPLFYGGYAQLEYERICELLPQLAFLILMPAATAQIIKK